MPFAQNTGGFFIAVFEKVKSFGTFDCKKERDFKEEPVVDEPVASETIAEIVSESPINEPLGFKLG
jgi:hypothetical protein